ncbi:MAG: trimeric intracellular cation channel family protein [Actinomycetales bacterium]|jgi:uncharacterized membrane protein YeiH
MTFNLSLALDLAGVFFFAVSGCLLAARRGFDLIGSLLLGSLVGLGGGVARDVIINAGPPAAFSDPWYLLPPLLAAAVVYFLFQSVDRLGRWLNLFDAAGLGLFCITGTLKALTAGLNPASAILLGVTTAVGGGLLRDITANRVPKLFDPKDLYAIPAFLGAAITAVLWYAHALNLATGGATAVVVIALRIFSPRFAWQAPLAVHGRARTPGIRG